MTASGAAAVTPAPGVEETEAVRCRVRASFVLADAEAGEDAAVASPCLSHADTRAYEREREREREKEDDAVEEDDAKIAAPALMIRT